MVRNEPRGDCLPHIIIVHYPVITRDIYGGRDGAAYNHSSGGSQEGHTLCTNWMLLISSKVYQETGDLRRRVVS